MYLIDYHVHTSHSIDCEVKGEEMLKSAISLGIKEIAFTDHIEFDSRYNYINQKEYFNELSELKEKYKDKIKLLYGGEISLESTRSTEINNLIESNAFDFIIGSSHSVTLKDLYFDQKELFENSDKKEMYTLYLTELIKNINSCRDFSVYGHLDFVSRYGMYEDNSILYKDYSDYFDEILKALINSDKGIELNTSGYRYGINSPYPQFDIIKKIQGIRR